MQTQGVEAPLRGDSEWRKLTSDDTTELISMIEGFDSQVREPSQEVPTSGWTNAE